VRFLQRCESVKLVSYAEEMNSRYRHTMEDAHAVVDGFGGDKGTGFFGVYDGHGGRAIAEFLRTNLHDTVVKELHAKGSKSVEECLKSAFLLTGACQIRCHCASPHNFLLRMSALF